LQWAGVSESAVAGAVLLLLLPISYLLLLLTLKMFCNALFPGALCLGGEFTLRDRSREGFIDTKLVIFMSIVVYVKE
jgi:hypothetical protein